MNKWIIILGCVFLTGCVTTSAVGSRGWYQQRATELELARDEGEISTEKYLDMKTEIDKIRKEYVDENRIYYSTSYYGHYGHHSHHRRRHHHGIGYYW